MEVIREDLAKISDLLTTLDEKREEILLLTRELTRKTKEAIFAMHRGDWDRSSGCLEEARTILKRIASFRQESPYIYYSGSVIAAQAEYVEAEMLHSVLRNRKPPSFTELGVEPQSYLLGLGDLVGELRRSVLDELRRDNVERAWQLMELMEGIYFELEKFSLPEALVPGLRHKVDVARALIENTRKDILFSEKSSKLSRKIEEFLSKEGESRERGLLDR
ncbi:haloacid dehalogenase [Infirmifilum lucidum]|uniref:Haloacid dehalogenase n=1 Tax=Infirmifilum lucidum TaxID=2776706 RepID=A0A7L9FKU3_9CREN|nr:haloacid dehalogenase [Infirmifilum lucidum]QOJ79643.1 haloacid dehalogenase [Infirmifilum lucidum]